MKKTTYTMIGLSLVLLVSLGFNAMPEPTHKCDSRELEAYCFDMSSTGKTCYTLPSYTGGKRCTEGWKEIEYIDPDIPTKNSGKKWLCNQYDCVKIM